MMFVKEYWNKIAEVPRAITPGDQWQPELVQNIVAALLDWIPEDVLREATLLDVGCGEGRLIAGLASRAKEYIGVDVSSVVLQAARQVVIENNLTNVKFVELQNERFIVPGWGDKFDVVVSWTVFMHLPRDIFLHYLKCIHMYLKPKGYFAFQLNSPTATSGNKDDRFDGIPDNNRFRARWYPEWLVGDYLAQVGFEIVSISDQPEEPWKVRKRT